MSRRFAHPFFMALVAVLATAAPAGLVAADGPRNAPGGRSAKKPAQPILVLNAAGFDRVLGSVDGLLKMVERPELSLPLRGLLAVSTNGLQGIDRQRPFGVMTFINPGDAPEPVGVVYVPVAGGPEFLASLKALEFSVKPAASLPGGYQVAADKQAFAVRLRGRYAFLARTLESLKRDFGDPAARFAELSREFDACVRFELAATPVGLKALVLDYSRASAAMGFAIRRGETAAAHALRKSIGMAFLAGFEEAVRDGESLTLGFKVSKTAPGVQVVARLSARAGSPLANGLNDLRAGREQPPLDAGRSTDFRVATNWKPPGSLAPVFNAVVAAMPVSKNGHSRAAETAWSLLRRGLFETGIRLVAWSPEGTVSQPATVAVVSFPNAKTAAAHVQGALAVLRTRGLRTEHVAAPKGPVRFQRVTRPPGATADTAGAVALLQDTAWIAVGGGKIVTFLQREMNASAAPAVGKPADLPRRGAELFHVSGRWSVLKSLLQSGTWPARTAKTSRSEWFELTIAHQPNALVLRATLPAAAVREAAAPVLKRLFPR